jgi:SAM-dependent methyltransferase
MMQMEPVDRLLDQIVASLKDGASPEAQVAIVDAGLLMARSYMPPTAWRDFCARAQQHPLIELFKQDPFLARVIEKPRGYAGDATMIDLIYGTGSTPERLRNSTPMGRKVYNATTNAYATLAVRERRSVLAKLVDDAAARVAEPAVFAVAAGHLREAELSTAFARGTVGRWLALDQDEESIAEIDHKFGGRVETIPASISAILKDQIIGSDFDLIYAAGLYDYLPTKLACRLTQKLATMLRPGGTLMFANFASDVWDAGFMEAVMDWHLILRNQAEMREIADSVAEVGTDFTATHWSGIGGAIHYCEIKR